MDYNKGCQLWENRYLPTMGPELSRSKDDTIKFLISRIAEKLGDGKYSILQDGVLTVIQVFDDFIGEHRPYRKTVRVETNPRAAVPRSLTNILKRVGFKSLKLN